MRTLINDAGELWTPVRCLKEVLVGCKFTRPVVTAALISAYVVLGQVDGSAIHAASFAVNDTADTNDVNPGDGTCTDNNGRCTLRAAIDETNALTGSDDISLPAGTYFITNPLSITDELTLAGATTQSTILDGSPMSSSNATIKVDPDGAAITATIKRLTACNRTDSHAIRVYTTGSLILEDVAIRDNIAGPNGGGISSVGYLSMNRCTVSGNYGLNGGGIAILGGSADLINSTISNNRAFYSGGGIAVIGEVFMNNVTITENVSEDEVTSYGGGIRVQGSGVVYVRNTIVAGNTDLSGVAPDISGEIISQDFNLIGDSTGTTITGDVDHNITGASAALGPLAQNWGDTMTHALTLTSPALESGDPLSCRDTDQRLLARPQGDVCDIGSYEYVYPLFADGFESGDTTAWN